MDCVLRYQVDVWYNKIVENMSNSYQNLASVPSLSLSLSLTQINSGEVLILGPIGYG